MFVVVVGFLCLVVFVDLVCGFLDLVNFLNVVIGFYDSGYYFCLSACVCVLIFCYCSLW